MSSPAGGRRASRTKRSRRRQLCFSLFYVVVWLPETPLLEGDIQDLPAVVDVLPEQREATVRLTALALQTHNLSMLPNSFLTPK